MSQQTMGENDHLQQCHYNQAEVECSLAKTVFTVILSTLLYNNAKVQ